MGSLRSCNFWFRFYNKIVAHSRHLHTSSEHQAANISLSKQGKIFNKLYAKSSKKKRKFIFDDTPSIGLQLNLGQHLKYNKENSRRIAVLNSLFMKHISDLLVTGNIGVDVISKGLEISRVSMNQNFNQLNVYWGANSEENIADLEAVLPNVGFTLRHELSQLKVMGVVPRILFVKDKHFNNGAIVDHLLRQADFGEDHVPTELESDFKNVSLIPPNNQENNEKVTSETITPEDEEVMPVMRQDVFNLDHQFIMNKILKRRQKSRAIHRFEPNLAIQSEGFTSDTSRVPEEDKMTKEERKQALAKFIRSRRILVEKKNQNKHKSDCEDYFTKGIDNEDNEEEDFDVEDYIEEDFEESKYRN